MHATYGVMQDGKLRYKTEWTLGGTEDEARQRAHDVAQTIKRHQPHTEVTIERVTYVNVSPPLNIGEWV